MINTNKSINFGKVDEYTVQNKQIRDWALKLRQLRPILETKWEEPADWVIKNANIYGKSVKSLTITLTPSGCAWASSGGCTMCGEYEGSTKGKSVTPMFHIAQFASSISNLISENKPSWLRIYQEGNYTNPNEIENSAQITILKLGSLIKGIKRITIESMAKYITQKSVENIIKAVNDRVELEIGMGFEAENDVVRNICVNKGESKDDFKKAIDVLQKNNIRSLAYVLLKPPFLTETEAIKEAILTINYANDLGFNAISLEPLSIHRYTIVHALSLEGLYQLPWLWSMVKVIQSIDNVQDLRIGGIGFYPRPINVAYNRHSKGSTDCNKVFWNAIKEYGKTRNKELFKKLYCICKKEWEEECQISSENLKTRIDKQLRILNIDKYKIKIASDLISQSNVNYTTAIKGGTQYK